MNEPMFICQNCKKREADISLLRIPGAPHPICAPCDDALSAFLGVAHQLPKEQQGNLL